MNTHFNHTNALPCAGRAIFRYDVGESIPCQGDLIDSHHLWLYVCHDDGGTPLHMHDDLVIESGQAVLTQLHPACRIGSAGRPGWALFQIPKQLLSCLQSSHRTQWQSLRLAAAQTSALMALVAKLEAAMAAPDTHASSLLALQREICQLLWEAESDAPGAKTAKLKKPNARDAARLQRLIEYLKARLGAPLSLEDFAKATGMSVRGVHLLCRQHHGMSPMELLRRLRLDAVHERLTADPESHIGEIALQYGFGHLGRFSQYYKTQFGELPTETRMHVSSGRAN